MASYDAAVRREERESQEWANGRCYGERRWVGARTADSLEARLGYVPAGLAHVLN